MEKIQANKTSETITLPVLKPIALLPDFIAKIKGDSLNSEVIMLIAEDEDNIFFVSCRKEWKENYENDKNFVKIFKNEGISDDGNKKQIDLAEVIDLSTIFKINYYELKNKINYKEYPHQNLPYLGIQNQLDVVNQLTEKLNSLDNLPKLVIIKKALKKPVNSSMLST